MRQTNLGEQVALVRSAAPAAAAQTAVNGAGVDMQDYEGVLFLVHIDAAVAGGVATLKAQQSSDNGVVDTFADLAGASEASAAGEANKVLAVDVFKPIERWVRPVLLRATADITSGAIVAIRYGPKKQPTSHDTTTIKGGVEVVSPAEA